MTWGGVTGGPQEPCSQPQWLLLSVSASRLCHCPARTLAPPRHPHTPFKDPLLCPPSAKSTGTEPALREAVHKHVHLETCCRSAPCPSSHTFSALSQSQSGVSPLSLLGAPPQPHQLHSASSHFLCGDAGPPHACAGGAFLVSQWACAPQGGARGVCAPCGGACGVCVLQRGT